MASRACCHPHLADARLEHLAPASSGTLERPSHSGQGNLGTLRRASTQGSGGLAVMGLKWVARSAAACLGSSPGGGLSLLPPNTTTAPKAGFCAARWVACGPARPRPFHLGLLRDMKKSGAVCPHALRFPSRGRRGSTCLEPSNCLYHYVE